jgi:broad specificity phosphatase PhoE
LSRLVLVRHAAVDTGGRYWGATDLPLSRQGVDQLPALTRRLADAHLDGVYASDLARARETADAVAEAAGCVVELDAGLREIDFGLCEGLTFEEIASCWPAVANALVSDPTSFSAPGGESFADFVTRVNEFVVNRLTGKEGNIAVVAHRGSLALIAAAVLKRSPRETLQWPLEPAGIKVLELGRAAQPCDEPVNRRQHGAGGVDLQEVADDEWIQAELERPLE